MKKLSVFFTLFFALAALSAQEDTFFFAAELFKRAAVTEKIVWGPNWPGGFPFDAFAAKGFSGLTLKSKDAGCELTLKRNKNSLFWADFPFLLNGSFVQAHAFITGGVIQGFSLDMPTASESEEMPVESLETLAETQSIEIEILQFDVEGKPVMCRINNTGTFYFVLWTWQSDEILETWFNEKGIPVCIFENKKDSFKKIIFKSDDDEQETNTQAKEIEETEMTFLYFDNMNNITKIQNGDTICTALYNAKGVLYWDTNNEKHEIQWDEKGLPLRMSTTIKADNESNELNQIVKPSYTTWEYDFDAKGNWVSRREIIFTEYSGVLISSGGGLWERVIEYD